MKEIWKPIPGWPYEASSGGRIRRSAPGGSPVAVVGRVLSVGHTRRGYQNVNLCDGDNRWMGARVHTLVALAFHGPRPEGHQVNHKDCNPRNNKPSNLEWVTPAENMAHAAMMGRLGGIAQELREEINDLARCGLFDQQDLAEIYGYSKRTIGDLVELDPPVWAWGWFARWEARHLRFYYRVLEAA